MKKILLIILAFLCLTGFTQYKDGSVLLTSDESQTLIQQIQTLKSQNIQLQKELIAAKHKLCM